MSADVLEFGPARWQLVMMTLMPLTICGAFTASCWFFVPGVWGRLAFVFAIFGLYWAQAGFREMRRVRIRADAEGVSLTGSSRGYADQHARWDDVALCTVEKRASPDDVGTPHLILKDRAGADLFALYLRFLSRNDTARLLRFIKAELESRNVPFDVPAKWYGF